jgi:serine protease Do
MNSPSKNLATDKHTGDAFKTVHPLIALAMLAIASWAPLESCGAQDNPVVVTGTSETTSGDSVEVRKPALPNRADSASLDIPSLETDPISLKSAIKFCKASIVHIEAEKKETSPNGREKTISEAGAGVVFKHGDTAYVLTNMHVVKDAPITEVTVLLDDGRFFHPEEIRYDHDTDLAVLYLPESDIPCCTFGNSDQIEIGDFVFAIGSPFGLSHSVTYGIVSARGRRNLDLGEDEVKYQDFIQTDAAINPGNSGGPLMNLKGEVIGINTAIASNSGGNDGIGFSIPAKMARKVAIELIESGRVSRGFLGVTLDSKFDLKTAASLGMNRFIGAHVTKVSSGSPAQTAGIKVNDVITEFDGIEIQDDAHLVNLVSLTESGKKIPVELMRAGKRISVFTEVTQRK